MNYHKKLDSAIQFGLLVKDIKEDEQIHRTATITKPRSKNGWYVSYGDLLVMGDWGTGLSQVWKANNYQRNFIDAKRIKEAIDSNKREKLKEQKKSAIRARNKYLKAQQVDTHPYLSAKNIAPAKGLKIAGRWLLVPLYDVATNQLVNLQQIAPDGTKLFLKGAKIKGTGFFINSKKKTSKKMFVCEGFATASSIHQVSQEFVIAAMNAGNLLAVAKAAEKRWPDVEIIVAGDDDWLTEQETGINPGKSKAIEAANSIKGKVSFPPFTIEQRKAGLTDWNDYYCAKTDARSTL